MENLETYLYVFFAVIYIISRILKARSKQNQQQKPVPAQQQQRQARPVNPTSKPKKAFSFDDILKEFEKSLSGEETVPKEAFPVKEIKHEKPMPVAVKPSDNQAKPYQRYQHKTYKDGKEIIRKKLVFERNENLALKKEVVSDYVKMLQNPEDFKNAIVLSEIINRKYF